MSEKYVAEYVEILDDHGERKGVCVTDTEHTVSFEVKDEIAAMELCELLNKLFGENEELGISIKLFEDDIATKDKKIDEQQDLIEELYDFRLTYNALLFNEWAENQKYEVYKSRRHSNGELCFDGEYFIVVAQLPTGQVTNHYHIRHWDMFKVNEYEKVKEEFDGHTPSDVIERLQQVIDV